jgi:hypothetical protein
LIQCALCPRQIKGGFLRVKKHLVGGYKDILKCPNTTTAIARELKAALDEGKRDIQRDNTLMKLNHMRMKMMMLWK